MHRVHDVVPQSGEIVLIDATANLDRSDSKLFHLVCPTPIGALPLAEIITTREDTDTVMFALQVLQSVLPDRAFYGRGRTLGPQVFMTDDSDAERNALSAVWPNSVLLLCIFHVLQAQWTWLWDAKHGIAQTDKPALLLMFRRVLYAETEEELSDRLEEMYADATMIKYPQYQNHLIKDTFPKLKAWSIARRFADNLPTSNNNTNNLVESSFRYTKDIQFNRMKAHNIVDMLAIVLDNSEFYSNKCVDAANNRIESWLKNCQSKYVAKHVNIDPAKIVQIGQDSYLVPSETQEGVSYVVDMVLRCCSCPQGKLHGPCKHKTVVAQSRNVPSFDVIPTKCSELKQLYMFLGTGKRMKLDWFLPLQAETSLSVDVPQVGASADVEQLEAGSESVVDVARVIAVPVEENQVDTDAVKEILENVLKKLRAKLLSRIEHDPTGYNKALGILDKTVDRLPVADSALQKTLCSFGKCVTQVAIYPGISYL